jgi:hypothetical protein
MLISYLQILKSFDYHLGLAYFHSSLYSFDSCLSAGAKRKSSWLELC